MFEGPGILCLKHHLLFYSFIPKNVPIILFNLGALRYVPIALHETEEIMEMYH